MGDGWQEDGSGDLLCACCGETLIAGWRDLLDQCSEAVLESVSIVCNVCGARTCDSACGRPMCRAPDAPPALSEDQLSVRREIVVIPLGKAA